MNTLLTHPAQKSGRAGPIGSVFKAEEIGPVTAAGVLTREQICAKYNLTPGEYRDIEAHVRRTKVSDALFSWPDGPRYDTLLYLVAYCR